MLHYKSRIAFLDTPPPKPAIAFGREQFHKVTEVSAVTGMPIGDLLDGALDRVQDTAEHRRSELLGTIIRGFGAPERHQTITLSDLSWRRVTALAGELGVQAEGFARNIVVDHVQSIQAAPEWPDRVEQYQAMVPSAASIVEL